jgi:Holliday junction resolvasome RuvABC endonuclease subunit
MKTYIGIDPGKSGSIAVRKGDHATAHKMPDTDRDIWALFRSIIADDMMEWRDNGCFAVLEIVHSSPQMGVKSAFTFGQGYGGLRMALIASGIPFEGVTPQKWQKALGCLSGGDKNKTKDRAQTLFPNIKVTHGIADGLLIAEYCARTY